MKRSDNHKFVNFPFPPAKRLANTNLNNGKIKFQIDKNRTETPFPSFGFVFDF